jgi:hypothetical protein
MGYRSYFFVRRHVVVRNYGSTLMNQHRLTVTKIVFVAPSTASSSSSTTLCQQQIVAL